MADGDYAELYAHRNDTDYINRITELAKKLLSHAERPQTIIVTGILRREAEDHCIGNLIVSERETDYLESFYTGESFSGTGDLFASVVMGSLVNGQSASEAVQKAMRFLQPAIESATREGIPRNHGVNFEKYLSLL